MSIFLTNLILAAKSTNQLQNHVQRSYLYQRILLQYSLRKHPKYLRTKITESKVKSGAVLDQEKLEDEVKRITELMQEKGYYS